MIERPLYLKQLIKYKDKDIIKVITGVRRCGKSVLLFDIYAKYLRISSIYEEYQGQDSVCWIDEDIEVIAEGIINWIRNLQLNN